MQADCLLSGRLREFHRYIKVAVALPQATTDRTEPEGRGSQSLTLGLACRDIGDPDVIRPRIILIWSQKDDEAETVTAGQVNIWHLRGDLIRTYRTVRGHECALGLDEFCELAGTDRLRGHPSKLQRKLAHSDVRRTPSLTESLGHGTDYLVRWFFPKQSNPLSVR
ncbi:hypothetical protein SprV_0301336300 [Sparganum proliferum]